MTPAPEPEPEPVFQLMLIVMPQASIFAHLLLLLVRVVIVAMNPTCLCLPKLLQSVCTTAALVSIAEMIQLPAQAQSPCHMLNTEPTAGYQLGRVIVKTSPWILS